MAEKNGGRAEYKSAIRSKKLIRQAYIELMREKPLDKITVTDIVKRADINRGTFYAHFSDTHAVLEQIENEIIDRMKEFLSEFNYRNFFQNPLPPLLKIVRFLDENQVYTEFLTNSRNAEPFLIRVRGIFVSYMENDVQISDDIKKSPEFRIRMLFFAGGIINVYREWLRGGSEQSLDEMSLILSKLITGGEDTLIGK